MSLVPPFDIAPGDPAWRRETRRVSDPGLAQKLWDAILAVRAQKQIPAIVRMSRYMNRFYQINKGGSPRAGPAPRFSRPRCLLMASPFQRRPSACWTPRWRTTWSSWSARSAPRGKSRAWRRRPTACPPPTCCRARRTTGRTPHRPPGPPGPLDPP